MQELVVVLLAWIKVLSGYPVPARLPVVHMVPHAYIQERACNGSCQVAGWFPPGEQIYLDDRLDLRGNVRARAILLHELVHYVQQLSGRFDGMDPCLASIVREREAYSIQNRYLAEQGVLPGQAMPIHLPPCRPPDPAAGTRSLP